MSVTLTRKPTPITAWHLSDQTEMLDALSALADAGWRGALAPVGEGWRLELNADNPTRQIIAEVGDWLINDAGWLRKLSDAEVAADYEESA